MAKILVDLDGVLMDSLSAQLDVLNKTFRTCWTTEQLTHYWTEEFMEDSHVAFLWGPECFLDEKLQINAEAVEGGISGVKRLIDMGHIPMIVSDRPKQLFEVTRAWLDNHDLDTIRLMFTRHIRSGALANGARMSKSQAAYLYKLTHVIEDSPHNARLLAKRAYVDTVYLLDKPYNQEEYLDKDIIRCDRWLNVCERLESVA